MHRESLYRLVMVRKSNLRATLIYQVSLYSQNSEWRIYELIFIFMRYTSLLTKNKPSLSISCIEYSCKQVLSAKCLLYNKE